MGALSVCAISAAAVARDEVEHRDVRRQLLGRERHLEMRDLPGSRWRPPCVAASSLQQGVAVERRVSPADAHRRVQPAEQRLALGVHLVVHVGGRRRGPSHPRVTRSNQAAVPPPSRADIASTAACGYRAASAARSRFQALRVEEVDLVHHDGMSASASCRS